MLLPRFTSIPAFSDGEDPIGKSAFSVRMLSPINRVCVFAYVVLPEIVRLPVTTTSPLTVPPDELNFVAAKS